MCAAFIRDADRLGWDAYPETGGYDIVMSHRKHGWQVGVEAKQQFNAHVVCQAADRLGSTWRTGGPDFLAVLTPDGGDGYVAQIARKLGIVVIRALGEPDKRGFTRLDGGGSCLAFNPHLPGESIATSVGSEDYGWPQHLWASPIDLPEYRPDVAAGKAAPVALTEWKIRAIKICVILDRRGYVTPADFSALGISSSRWVQGGWVVRDGKSKRWTAGGLPDFRAQHPKNYGEIERDFEKWSKLLPDSAGDLLSGSAQ